MTLQPAPKLQVSEWLNTKEPITLEGLRGKVVLIEAFQMLCPGCVSLSLPQAMKVQKLFDSSRVAVIGLHSVFEHHEAQGSRAALAAFLHEYRINFPVAIDAQDPSGRLPQTMSAYQMRGTPTTILIDQAGHLRAQHFGAVDDMQLGAEITTLLNEGAIAESSDGQEDTQAGCTDEGCAVPTS
ncbi:MAG: TlpA disulfide reductase family protein [Parasphingorhabdus sp.]